MTSEESSRLAVLEAAVDDLRRALARAKPGQIRTMAHTHRCPACNGGVLLHFKRVGDVAHGKMIDLTLQKDFSAWWGVKMAAGALEAYACKNCRLVEWHAVSLDDVQPDGETVVELTAHDDPNANIEGPYR
jgi:hypothetical protein